MFAAAALVIAVLPRFMGEFRLSQFTFVAIYFIALLGLNILTGYNGQISLGHGAFMGIGAYVGAVLSLGTARARGAAARAAGLAAARRRDAPGLHDPARRADHGRRRLPVRHPGAPARRRLARAGDVRARRLAPAGREAASARGPDGRRRRARAQPADDAVRLGHLRAPLALLRGLGDGRDPLPRRLAARQRANRAAPGARSATARSPRRHPASALRTYKTLAFGVSSALRRRGGRAPRDRGLVREPGHVSRSASRSCCSPASSSAGWERCPA